MPGNGWPLLNLFQFLTSVYLSLAWIIKTRNLHYPKHSSLFNEFLIFNSQLLPRINLKFHLVKCEQNVSGILGLGFLNSCQESRKLTSWFLKSISTPWFWESKILCLSTRFWLKATTLVSFSLTHFGRSPSVKWYNICSPQAGQA